MILEVPDMRRTVLPACAEAAGASVTVRKGRRRSVAAGYCWLLLAAVMRPAQCNARTSRTTSPRASTLHAAQEKAGRSQCGASAGTHRAGDEAAQGGGRACAGKGGDHCCLLWSSPSAELFIWPSRASRSVVTKQVNSGARRPCTRAGGVCRFRAGPRIFGEPASGTMPVYSFTLSRISSG